MYCPIRADGKPSRTFQKATKDLFNRIGRDLMQIQQGVTGQVKIFDSATIKLVDPGKRDKSFFLEIRLSTIDENEERSAGQWKEA